MREASEHYSKTWLEGFVCPICCRPRILRFHAPSRSLKGRVTASCECGAVIEADSRKPHSWGLSTTISRTPKLPGDLEGR